MLAYFNHPTMGRIRSHRHASDAARVASVNVSGVPFYVAEASNAYVACDALKLGGFRPIAYYIDGQRTEYNAATQNVVREVLGSQA